ncbi:unnamed protein product, partial [Pleuronectes platessa]
RPKSTVCESPPKLTTPYLRVAPAAGDNQLTGAATHKPDAVEPEKQTDHTVKIAGVIAGILLFVIIFLGVVLLMKKRKLAKKRKETLNSTRQEMTVMVNSMDKSYTEQGTNCDEALSFMDTHSHTLNTHSHTLNTLNTRSECALTLTGRSECNLTLNGRAGSSPSSFTLPKANTLTASIPTNAYYPDESQNMGSDTSSLVQSHSLRKREPVDVPYQTGQLHPAIRVADLLQHITQMKCSEGYGFKEEYECGSDCASLCITHTTPQRQHELPKKNKSRLSPRAPPPRPLLHLYQVRLDTGDLLLLISRQLSHNSAAAAGGWQGLAALQPPLHPSAPHQAAPSHPDARLQPMRSVKGLSAVGRPLGLIHYG